MKSDQVEERNHRKLKKHKVSISQSMIKLVKGEKNMRLRIEKATHASYLALLNLIGN